MNVFGLLFILFLYLGSQDILIFLQCTKKNLRLRRIILYVCLCLSSFVLEAWLLEQFVLYGLFINFFIRILFQLLLSSWVLKISAAWNCLIFCLQHVLVFLLNLLFTDILIPVIFLHTLSSTFHALISALHSILACAILWYYREEIENQCRSIVRYSYVFLIPTTSLMIWELYLSPYPSEFTYGRLLSAGIAALLVLTLLLLFYLFEIHRSAAQIPEFFLIRFRSMQINRKYNMLTEEYTRLRMVEHDIKNQLMTMDILAARGEYEQARKLGETLLEKLKQTQSANKNGA